MIRLDKYLADLGIGTRKEIKAFIKQGYVRVEGFERALNDMKIDENSAEVYFDGERLEYVKNVYMLMNKPAGVISATRDPEGSNATVIDILPEQYRYSGLFPVGRLDKDTVGLLLLTNDGAFAHSMTSPKKNIIKTYYAIISGSLGERDADMFRAGIRIDGGEVCRPAELYTLEKYAEKSGGEDVIRLCRKYVGETLKEGYEVIVEMSEGKYHQVKRMFDAVGKKVLYLKRIGFGDYVLPYDMEEGDVADAHSER